jgi:hypothetical protein
LSPACREFALNCQIQKLHENRKVASVPSPNCRPPCSALARQFGDIKDGEATILGKTYQTAYEPIRDSANKVVGIYYVGYLKE